MHVHICKNFKLATNKTALFSAVYRPVNYQVNIKF